MFVFALLWEKYSCYYVLKVTSTNEIKINKVWKNERTKENEKGKATTQK